ncbi:MAG: DUF1385 domain-containing protein [Firmicutes bacterium]|nr:DUF1385 domain-containing protein [Bacillota bacterium]HOB34894.1 DUF1385 domain-containing protein [Bacillota bacterium]HPZ91138.1 DUF1385 domain-containing protein [Bacillota bacterium]HQE02005.1 DUF1385 domain-containing protein [Bacillota bacterium]
MKRDAIGGQAVLEGVMMRSRDRQALAVRAPDGNIITEAVELRPLAQRWPLLRLPVLRGVAALADSLAGAVSSLGRSAQLLDEEEIPSWQLAAAVAFALVLVIGLFFLLPAALVNVLRSAKDVAPVLLNMAEGLLRIVFFVGYLLLGNLSPDIRRTFQYHGAEHKAIHCWEQDLPLTPEAAAGCSRLHPRCGTSFLLLIVVLSTLLFSLFNPAALGARLLLRLAMLPVLAGLGYELTRWTAKSNSLAARLARAPGLLLQKLTTREPDLAQLEVALAALGQVVDPSQREKI